MRRRTFVVMAALTMILSVFSPTAAAEYALASDLTAADGSGPALDSTYARAAVVDGDGQKLVSVIVKLESDSLASYEGDLTGMPATSPRVTGDARLDLDSADARRYRAHLAREHTAFEENLEATLPGSRVTEKFDVILGGVAALVPIDEVKTVEAMDGVQAVYLDQMEKLATDTTPEFLGVSTSGGAWDSDYKGEGVVVGVIDSGIWPEHPSVADDGTYPAPPTTWSGTGCEFGNEDYNANDVPFACNNKLIAAYDFTDTYEAVVGLIPTEFDSARDSNGHGTHTATTAAGNEGVAATLLGVPRGNVSGIAPRAHLAVYKGCGLSGCFSSDTSAAVQQAIADGVDVINYSISGGGDPYGDVVSLAFLDAFNAGVLVTPSAGNSGPGPDSVGHREPWTLTVGASTSSRHFLSTVTLTADNGDTLEVVGATVTGGIPTPTPVIFPPEGAELCLDPFPAGTFSGEIVVCDRGVIARVAKSFNVAAGGAGGLLLLNVVPQGLATDNHFIPSVHLENTEGDAIKAFMASHTDVTATFTDSVASTVQGDKMAAFSSRGGSMQALGISKPDVTAPGVQILAGHTPVPEDEVGGLPGEFFQSIQGTSMSAPHAAGAAALVAGAHPEWSPAQIKSALMLTAITDGVTKEDGTAAGDAFDYGSGRIDPTAAIGAGLTMDTRLVDVDGRGTGAHVSEYVVYEHNLWDANYPSIYVPVMPGELSTQRTFTNTVDSWERWNVWSDAPSDLVIDVPRRLFVRPNGSTTIDIDLDASAVPLGVTRFGAIYLSNGDQTLRMPVTVVRSQPDVTLDHSCDATELERREATTCRIDIANTSLDDAAVDVTWRAPRQLKLGDVYGARTVGGVKIRYSDTLVGEAPPTPGIAEDPGGSPAGYLPLSSFSPTDVGATDESIANFSVPQFMYAGMEWDMIGIVSNGYIVVGGGSGSDVDFLNSNLPDPSMPNNVLAPFWTDLNPAAGGRVLIETLTDGTDSWIVIEWEGVPNFGDGSPNSFQIWIGYATDANPNEDITFTYGDVSPGDGGFLTVGAEDSTGTSGSTYYYDGAGTAPVAGTELRVASTPGTPGGTHSILFEVEGKHAGEFSSVVKMVSDAFYGTSTAVVEGEVTGGALPRAPGGMR